MRDSRDPQEIGLALMALRKQHPRTKFTKLADRYMNGRTGFVPDNRIPPESDDAIYAPPSSNGVHH